MPSQRHRRTHLQLKRVHLDQDAFLYWLLLSLLLPSYVLIVYFTLALGFPLPSSRFDHVISIIRQLLAVGVLLFTLNHVFAWIRAGVRDLVYGQHERPNPALAQVNRQLASSLAPQSILPTIAATIAATLKLPFVEIEAYRTGTDSTETGQLDTTWVTSFGTRPAGAAIDHMPLLYHDIKIGELRVAAQRWDVPLSRADWAILSELARQVGIALYAAQLTEELQRARERLVLGREEERRRIRNDLHDGLAPTLSALQLQLSAIRRLIPQDPAQAEQQINQLSQDLRAATAEIRQLIYDLRPPMLDELGLVGAIRNFKVNDALRLEVIAPPTLPKLPAALEVALYRIASEALHNVVRHAHATECAVHLETNGQQITLCITDNGTSQPEHYAAGIGLQSMRERAAELNGTLTITPVTPHGTQVIAHLPLGF